MDLIPKQFKQNSIKTKGISISGSRPDFSFLSRKGVFYSLMVVALCLFVWAGVKGYDFYLQRTSKKIVEEIKNIQASQNLDAAQKFIEIDQKAGMVEKLLKNHIYSSQFFDILEKLTLPQVQWKAVSLNTVDGEVSLSGQAASYSVLAKQIISFQEANFEIKVSGIRLTKNGVEFSAGAKFDPKILLK